MVLCVFHLIPKNLYGKVSIVRESIIDIMNQMIKSNPAPKAFLKKRDD